MEFVLGFAFGAACSLVFGLMIGQKLTKQDTVKHYNAGYMACQRSIAQAQALHLKRQGRILRPEWKRNSQEDQL